MLLHADPYFLHPFSENAKFCIGAVHFSCFPYNRSNSFTGTCNRIVNNPWFVFLYGNIELFFFLIFLISHMDNKYYRNIFSSYTKVRRKTKTAPFIIWLVSSNPRYIFPLSSFFLYLRKNFAALFKHKCFLFWNYTPCFYCNSLGCLKHLNHQVLSKMS